MRTFTKVSNAASAIYVDPQIRVLLLDMKLMQYLVLPSPGRNANSHTNHLKQHSRP
jgi:hypothetical protein